MGRLAVAGLVVLAVVAGCDLLPGAAGGTTLNLSNGSTLPVTLVVNGTAVATVAPSDEVDDLPASRLPGLPWAVEVRTASGRVLTSMVVHAGDVVSGPNDAGGTWSRSVGARVDLSCGRIDVWSGTPMIGPAPGPGTPGDCEP